MPKNSSNRTYAVCARIMHIPLRYFRYTGTTSYDELPSATNVTQTCIEDGLTYEEAIKRISDNHLDYRTDGGIKCSTKRIEDLTRNLPSWYKVDVLCYYIYYLHDTWDIEEDEFIPTSYPIAKQQLYYQRTNGELRVFTVIGQDVNDYITNRFE